MTAVRFPNPIRATLDRLRDLVAEAPELSELTVSARDPATPGPRPHVRVSLDSTFRDARLNGSASVRLAVWHADGGVALDRALDLEAYLLGGGASADLRGFNPLGGPYTADDPDTAEPMAVVTITARLRPHNL